MKASAPIGADFQNAAAKVMAHCDALGEITDEPGRITRTFLSPATKRAQELVSQWMSEAGLDVRIDAAGNVIGRREGAVAEAKTFVIGSHLDTVPNAGKYDGILGVMMGIAVAELTRGAELPFALEVVGFSEEEGVRFGKPYIGSHAYAGTLDARWLGLKDKDGVTVEEAVRGFGLDAEALRSLKPRNDLLAYLEPHIEQGVYLEEGGLPVGVVTRIAAQTRFTVELIGQAGHAGTNGMLGRRDALAGAAEIIVAIEAIGKGRHKTCVATVGRIEVTPNASNVIAGGVRISVDVRSAEPSDRNSAVEKIVSTATEIGENRKLEMTILNRSDFDGTKMNGAMLARLLMISGDVMKNETLSPALFSAAGHDAAVMAAVAPVGMLFLRNPGGISHNPLESVAKGDVEVALKVMVAYFSDLAEAIRNGVKSAIPSMEIQ